MINSRIRLLRGARLRLGMCPNENKLVVDSGASALTCMSEQNAMIRCILKKATKCYFFIFF